MARIWIFACGRADNNEWEKMWPEWLRERHITVGCNSPQNLDLSVGRTMEEIKRAVNDGKNGRQAPILYTFAYNIKDGDYIVVRKGFGHVLGIGRVQGNIPPPAANTAWEPGNHYQIRTVNWLYASKTPQPLANKNSFNRRATIQDTGINAIDPNDFPRSLQLGDNPRYDNHL